MADASDIYARLAQQGEATYIRLEDMVGPGWLGLVASVDRKLAELDPEYRIDQIKEKFGGLRFYASTGPSPVDDDVARRFSHVVASAETASFWICEECGTTEGVTTEGSWVRTLCPSCRAADQARRLELFQSDSDSTNHEENA